MEPTLAVGFVVLEPSMADVIDLEGRGRRKPGHKRHFSIATMGRDIRLGLVTALNYGGKSWPQNVPLPQGVSPNAVDFWLQLKSRYPREFAQCAIRCIPREEQASDGFTFIVQQLAVVAGPVPGVQNSPVLEHVEHARCVEVRDE